MYFIYRLFFGSFPARRRMPGQPKYCFSFIYLKFAILSTTQHKCFAANLFTYLSVHMWSINNKGRHNEKTSLYIRWLCCKIIKGGPYQECCYGRQNGSPAKNSGVKSDLRRWRTIEPEILFLSLRWVLNKYANRIVCALFGVYSHGMEGKLPRGQNHHSTRV